MVRPSHKINGLAFRVGGVSGVTRELANEVAVAISYNGTSHAVLMATPLELEELAIGFSITEGIVSSIDEIEEVRLVEGERGIDVQVRLLNDASEKLETRQRSMAGPVGCGMCGLESIDAAMRDLAPLESGIEISAKHVSKAVRLMAAKQTLNLATRAVHAAGFYHPENGLIAVCEDVGRHNALDKLIGKMARSRVDMMEGLVAITSRLSVELVQKAVISGVSVLAAVSAPTGLAVELADRANLTLAAIVRGDEFEIFTHPERIIPRGLSNVA